MERDCEHRTSEKSKTAIILAGGKSSRMGQNKAFLKYEGSCFIEKILNTLEGYDEKIIVSNDPNLYQYHGVITVRDEYPNKGPLCGLYTGLLKSSNNKNVVVTVDTPFLTKEVLDYMLEELGAADVVVPVINGRMHPLCAVYNKSAIPVIEKALGNDERRVQNVLRDLSVKKVTENFFIEFIDANLCFCNINTKEDYESIFNIGLPASNIGT